MGLAMTYSKKQETPGKKAENMFSFYDMGVISKLSPSLRFPYIFF